LLCIVNIPLSQSLFCTVIPYFISNKRGHPCLHRPMTSPPPMTAQGASRHGCQAAACKRNTRISNATELNHVRSPLSLDFSTKIIIPRTIPPVNSFLQIGTFRRTDYKADEGDDSGQVLPVCFPNTHYSVTGRFLTPHLFIPFLLPTLLIYPRRFPGQANMSAHWYPLAPKICLHYLLYLGQQNIYFRYLGLSAPVGCFLIASRLASLGYFY